MKLFLLYISLIAIHCSLFAQQDSGFTNKAEAKNQMVNGLKEGKWVEFVNYDDSVVTDSTYIPYYRLSIYRAGKLSGKVRKYLRSGILIVEAYYIEGKLNETYKFYWMNGKLRNATPYINDVINGTVKEYYENGELQSETIYINGKRSHKDENENCKEIK
jgi:antitoxin component YwqK of YwqJK toxin-antitoxin module